MATDVTDANFETAVLDRSGTVPIVVDLWAPWCGPCKTLGPILEKVVEETEGAVELVKVNVDENPQVASTFRVQSIPAVYALKDRAVVDGFVGALGESAVREFIQRLGNEMSEADLLVEQGDEPSLRRALEIDPSHSGAVVALASVLLDRGAVDEALELLGRVPETAEVRRVLARARLLAADELIEDGAGIEARLDELLPVVKNDDQARQRFLDLLETLGPEDERRNRYRRALAAQLF